VAENLGHLAEETPRVGRPALLAACGRLVFRARDVIFPLVFLALVAVTSPGPGWRGADGVPGWLHLGAGLGLALAGQAWRAAVIGFAYIQRGGKDRRLAADRLVDGGFFACTRNPMYLGNLAGVTGLLLFHGSAVGVAAGLIFFLFAYFAIVVAEERFLAERFGVAYLDYCRRVPRWLPSPRCLARTGSGMRFDWQRLVRKEYGTTFAGATALLLLWSWDRYRLSGPTDGGDALRAAAAIWLPVLALYLIVRALKKRGALAPR
jgi:protein-S-isoprenylcysteine O-methyltransferase Ste14